MLAAISLAALSFTTSLPICAKESKEGKEAKEEKEGTEEKNEKKVIASIRPSGEVKPADLPALAKVSFEQALKAALAASAGSVIKAELEVEDGNLMYSFEIVGANKKVTEVEVDAGNGKVLDVDSD